MNLSHLNFEAPGSGVWRTDGLHNYRPITAMKMAAYVAIGSGWRIGNSRLTEAGAGEVRQMLLEDGGPTTKQLEERYDYRATYSIRDIPETLGEPDEFPIEPEWLPDTSRTLALLSGGQGARGQEQDTVELTGSVASPGVYEGTARVLEGAKDLGRIEEGDVLITTATNPAFSVILPQIGAIVTEYGGILSHAGIIAREFGLPAIVGCNTKATGIQVSHSDHAAFCSVFSFKSM